MALSPPIDPAQLPVLRRGAPVRGTYYVQTWGCQMNVEDSEQIELSLREIGFRPSRSMQAADVVVLNTCSVRKKPEDKAFSLLGELAEWKARRPHAVLGVCGCMAQLRAEEIRRRAPHVDFVVGTAHVATIGGLVEETLQRRRFAMRLDLPERKGAIVTDLPVRRARRVPKLKAFVPIQYGCDKFCTFCIVPTTRGRERSRPLEDIVSEVATLAAQGTKEVTLLGQTVNSYGKNLPGGKATFAQLLWRLAEVDGLERIRYTSPYPRDFREDLIQAHRECAKVMEHCHLPLQSGCDEVLRQMKRVYTLDQFRAIYRALRSVPEMSVTTDVIVGFPGETESQFEETLEVMRELRFDSAFMFAYSPRPGTPSAMREDRVPIEVARRRLQALIALQNHITYEVNVSSVGKVAEVLVEGPSEKDASLLKGMTRNMKTVHFAGEASWVGELVWVRLEEPFVWGFRGKVC